MAPNFRPYAMFINKVCTISSLCIFRWLVVLLISVIPIAWYKGSRRLLLSRLQSLILALLVLSVDSQNQTGFELDAYLLNGLYPQLFAMVLLPLTASKVYVHGMQIGDQDKSSPMYLLCLTYLSHAKTGLYCSILALVTLLVFITTKEFSKEYVKSAFKRFAYTHIGVLLFLSWWIIPCLISYPYVGGTLWRSYSSFSLSCITDMYVSGYLFDYRRRFIWLTCLTAIGLCISLKHLYGVRKCSLLHLHRHQLFSIWILLVTVLSCLFFVGNFIVESIMSILPFNLDVEYSSYLVGIHFCGLLLASAAVSAIINILPWFCSTSLIQKVLRYSVLLTFTAVMIKSSGSRVGEQVTLIEVSDQFKTALDSMKNNFKDGRVLAHSKLGTGGSWDLANIPYLTGKPALSSTNENNLEAVVLRDSAHNRHATGRASVFGQSMHSKIKERIHELVSQSILTYSRGHLDSLSVFYLEAMPFNNVHPEQFASLLRLYNIHYVAISTVFLDQSFLDLTNFKHMSTIDDIQFFQVDPEDSSFGYFDFIRIPGYIDGNLKHVREPVLESLDLYSREVLLYLNPRRWNGIREKSILNVQVLGVPFYEQMSSADSQVSLVSWKLNNQDIDSQEAVRTLAKTYDRKWTYSQVIEESRSTAEYHVLVHVENEKSRFDTLEHLLLKVSFHPFWRCFYFPVHDSYLLEDYDPYVFPPNRSSLTIHHVTPNLMSVALPAGRYHVIFRYRFPGILKLLALLCTFIFVNKFLRLHMEQRVQIILTFVWSRFFRCAVFVGMKLMRGSIILYYDVFDLILPRRVKQVFSFMTTPVLSIRRKYNVFAMPCVKSVHRSIDAMSNSQKALRNLAWSYFTKKNNEEVLNVLKDVNKNSLKVTDQERVEKVFDISMDEITQIKTLEKLGDGSFSSDYDSSCCREDVFVSPPTPPKHMKKSYRKKHARIVNSDDIFTTPQPDTELFKTASVKSPSPVLGNILQSLRKNSLSPNRKGSLSPGRQKTWSQGRRRSSSPDRRQTLTPDNTMLARDSSSQLFNDRKMTLVPDTNSVIKVENPHVDLIGKRRSSSGLSSDSDTFNYRKFTLVSDHEDSNEAEITEGISNEYFCVSSYNETFDREKMETGESDAIDIFKISHDDEDNDLDRSLDISLDDSFSPNHSSSPDHSLSSPEQFSSSPDGHSSPDTSFEYTTGAQTKQTTEVKSVSNICDTVDRETVINSDVYRIHIPKSKQPPSPVRKRRNTIHYEATEQFETRNLPFMERRATLGANSNGLEGHLEDQHFGSPRGKFRTEKFVSFDEDQCFPKTSNQSPSNKNRKDFPNDEIEETK